MQTYNLLRNLQAPNLLLNKDLAVVLKTLEEHFEPTPIVINEKFKFHMRNQIKTETEAEFLAELRRLAMHCKFDTLLNDTLRDGHVVGRCSEAIHKICHRRRLPLPKIFLWLRKQQPLTQSQCTKGQHLGNARLSIIFEEILDYYWMRVRKHLSNHAPMPVHNLQSLDSGVEGPTTLLPSVVSFKLIVTQVWEELTYFPSLQIFWYGPKAKAAAEASYPCGLAKESP